MVGKFDSDIKKILICQSLGKEKKNISQLSKELEIKRSTLNYYLSLLKAEGKIDSERIKEGVTGQPTIFSLTPKYLKQQKEKNSKKTKDVVEVLKQLKKKNGEMNMDEFISMGIPETGALLYTIEPKMVEQIIKLTPEGEKFLKDNSKK